MFNWYKIFNLADWLATELVSRNLSYFLDGIGQTEIMITQGNQTAVVVDDVFLPLNFNDQNPYQIDEWAIYLDANGDVWLGKEVE